MSWFIVGLALLLGGQLGAIGQGPGDVRSRARQGVPGSAVYADPRNRSADGIAAGGMVAQVGTIVVTTATDAATYTFVLNGITFNVVAGTGSTLASVATQIANAINQEPLAGANVAATVSSATVTITARRPGTAGAFTLTESDGKFTGTESVTAAADASAIGFGLAVIRTGFNGGTPGNTLGETENVVATPKTTLFTAQVQTITVPVVASNVIEAVIWEVRGEEEIELRRCQTTFATDKDTTLDALILELETTLPANTVSVTADNATATAIIFTAEVPGYEFRAAVFWKSGGTAPVITSADTVPASEATSLHRAWRGISKYSPAEEAASLTATTGSYPANSGVVYWTRAVVWVSNADSPGPSASGLVYVELAAGATQGQFYTTSSATRVALSRHVAKWERDGLVAADNLAAIRLEAA